MVLDTRVVAFPFASETVWNDGLSATGSAGGRCLSTGFDGDWAPEHLLLLAIESCFMSTFLSLAYVSDLEVLGYLSSARLDRPSTERAAPSVSLAPCIVVASADDRVRARELVTEASRESAMARLLGARLKIVPEVRVVPRTE